jgi:hypothetical protein
VNKAKFLSKTIENQGFLTIVRRAGKYMFSHSGLLMWKFGDFGL